MNVSGLVCAKSPGRPNGWSFVARALRPRAAVSPIRIVSWPCPVARSELHAALTRLRYMAGATDTVEPLIACGARSSPKLGSFQIAQYLTAGRAVVAPEGGYLPS